MSVEKLSPSLDSRELLTRPIDAFHEKSYELEGSSTMLWGVLDIYLRRLDPALGDSPYDSTDPTRGHSQEYKEKRQALYLAISRTPGVDIPSLTTAQISSSGILTLTKNNKKQISLNLIELWNKPEEKKIYEKTSKNEESLKESVSTEPYFDGSVLISYIPGTALTLAGAHALYDGGRMAKNGTLYVIDKVTIRDADGKMKIITLDKVYSGSRAVISNNITKILEKSGYIWDAVTKGWFSPVERSLGETYKAIKVLSYESYKHLHPESPLTEQEYKIIKNEIIEKTSMKGRLSDIKTILSKNALELVFFPIFFRHFSQYQNTATLAMGVAELGVFTLGAKVGAKYLPLPGVFRVLSPLIGGAGATILSHVGGDAVSLSRKKWEHLSTNGFGSLYTKGKSTVGHFALGWGVQEGVDMINKAGQWMVEKTGVASDDLDVGIPRIEIPLPGGEYVGTIPEVNMFQSTVSFGTAPWEWIRSAKGRNIQEWNKKVSLYQNILIRKIGELLEKYEKNRSMFASEKRIKEAGSKEKLLEEHLRDIIKGGGESDAFSSEAGGLIKDIVAYTSTKDGRQTKETIEGIIRNRTSQMYIDTIFLEKRGVSLEYKKNTLLPSISSQISTHPDLFRYMISIIESMERGAPLYKDETWKKVYDMLLENTNSLTVNFPHFQGKTTVGNAFGMYLDEVLIYSREREFLEELKNGNKKGVEWSVF